MSITVDRDELAANVKTTYRQVVANPGGSVPPPSPSIRSRRSRLERLNPFAGAGFFFDLADLRDGETVLDLPPPGLPTSVRPA